MKRRTRYTLIGSGTAVALMAGAGLATELFGTRDGSSADGQARPATPNSAPASPSAAAEAAGKLLCTDVKGVVEPSSGGDETLIRFTPVLSNGQPATEVVGVFTNTDQNNVPAGASETTHAKGDSVVVPTMSLWGKVAVTGQVATGELFGCPMTAIEVGNDNMVTTRPLEPVPTDPPTALPVAPSVSPS